MIRFHSVSEILQYWGDREPGRPALLAPNRDPLTYIQLFKLAVTVTQSLRAAGINRNDRVALVLPNGPEMAAAFLTVAAAATSAPLNPGYRAREYEFYLSDLNARAVIIEANLETPARDVASSLDIPVIDLIPQLDMPAGVFNLSISTPDSPKRVEYAETEDIALVLHTSGTTSRPKIVPLAHRNICTTAANIRQTLQLTSDDRCLNVMPLFHIHGLMAAVLSSVGAGASIVCTPGFHAESFFKWLADFEPTWYTAVPTMHQAILAGVNAHRDLVARSSIRLIRSSSASLPPQVMTALEEAFDAPVIESYGMTEAAHQMTSNPLPPAVRKPGTVGVAAGPEVAIMDEHGALLPVGQPGEIVIRGPNVTAGYENNPMANEAAFSNGWFRTGDQGIMDEKGYLTIVGRLKEMINRGGENIAPREIDEVLLNHPAVVQATAFAVAHPTLGEDVAAAVIIRSGQEVTPNELRQHAFDHLADYKVPSRIIIVDEIPKGPTGKLQRIGLAEKLAQQLDIVYAPPMGPLQHELVQIWVRHLKVDRLGVNDNFFSLGGDSITGAQVAAEMSALTGQAIPASVLFHAPTITELAHQIEAGIEIPERPQLVSVQPHGEQIPLFCIPSHEGDPFTFLAMSRYLGDDQPVYTFRFAQQEPLKHLRVTPAITELATDMISEMRSIQPHGPYLLNGYCYGGLVAFEMARQLRDQGEETGILVVVDAYLEGSIRKTGLARLVHHFKKFIKLPLAQKITYGAKRTGIQLGKLSENRRPFRGGEPPSNEVSGSATPSQYPGRITLMRPTEEGSDLYHDPFMGWKGFAAEISVYDIPAQRNTVFEEPAVRVLASNLRMCLEEFTA